MASEKGSLQDLKLANDKLEGASFDDIPEHIGQTFADPPQPGKYRFKFPASMAAIWAVVETEKHGTRINAVFDADAPLTIVQSPGSVHDGEEFSYRLSNVPRERTKEKLLISDMDLVLRACGITKRPATNKAYAEAMQTLADKDFGAQIEFSYNCNPKREIYADDGNGGQQKVEGKFGCGARYYQRDIAKVDGVQPLRITCGNPECGASVRAFPNLSGFTK